MLVASGIAYDKAWSKRENTAVLLAIPASIQAVIASSLGLGSNKALPKVVSSSSSNPTTCSDSPITGILSTPAVDIE